jgi:hypothetical protein
MGGCSSREPLQEQAEQFFSLPLDGSISVENGDGALRVVGWYEPRVRVATLRKAYTAARLRQIGVVTKTESNALAVRTEVLPARGFFADRSGTVEYTINAPETSHLTLRLTNGEISLQGLRGGAAKVDLANGRLTVINCFATIEASSASGVMECFFDWWEKLPASINFALGHGRIGVRLPVNARFRVNAQTASGRIGNGFGFTSSDRGPGQSLAGGTASQPLVSLGLHTGNGNIAIDAIR